MDDFAAERADELLALESIYEDNLSLLNIGEEDEEDAHLQKFEVRLNGHVGGEDRPDVDCVVRFHYTKNYPSEAPDYQIVNAKSLFQEDIAAIESLMESVIERSLGYIMIFDVLSEVQERLNLICEKRVAQRLKIEENRKKALEMEEEAKFRGDRVTVDSFLAWHAKFVEESRKLVDKNKSQDDAGSRRLTGKELFMRDSRFDDSDLSFLAEAGESVDIDERLFAEIGDIDLNDGELAELCDQAV